MAIVAHDTVTSNPYRCPVCSRLTEKDPCQYCRAGHLRDANLIKSLGQFPKWALGLAVTAFVSQLLLFWVLPIDYLKSYPTLLIASLLSVVISVVCLTLVLMFRLRLRHRELLRRVKSRHKGFSLATLAILTLVLAITLSSGIGLGLRYMAQCEGPNAWPLARNDQGMPQFPAARSVVRGPEDDATKYLASQVTKNARQVAHVADLNPSIHKSVDQRIRSRQNSALTPLAALTAASYGSFFPLVILSLMLFGVVSLVDKLDKLCPRPIFLNELKMVNLAYETLRDELDPSPNNKQGSNPTGDQEGAGISSEIMGTSQTRKENGSVTPPSGTPKTNEQQGDTTANNTTRPTNPIHPERGSGTQHAWTEWTKKAKTRFTGKTTGEQKEPQVGTASEQQTISPPDRTKDQTPNVPTTSGVQAPAATAAKVATASESTLQLNSFRRTETGGLELQIRRTLTDYVFSETERVYKPQPKSRSYTVETDEWGHVLFVRENDPRKR